MNAVPVVNRPELGMVADGIVPDPVVPDTGSHFAPCLALIPGTPLPGRLLPGMLLPGRLGCRTESARRISQAHGMSAGSKHEETIEDAEWPNPRRNLGEGLIFSSSSVERDRSPLDVGIQHPR